MDLPSRPLGTWTPYGSTSMNDLLTPFFWFLSKRNKHCKEWLAQSLPIMHFRPLKEWTKVTEHWTSLDCQGPFAVVTAWKITLLPDWINPNSERQISLSISQAFKIMIWRARGKPPTGSQPITTKLDQWSCQTKATYRLTLIIVSATTVPNGYFAIFFHKRTAFALQLWL